MELPLVVGVDGSQSSLQAVDWAVDEAARYGLPLRLLHASLWERYEGAALAEDLGRPSERAMSEAVVHAAAQHAHQRDPAVKVFTSALPEEPEGALLRASRGARALVTGRRGRGPVTELLLGSVSLAVAARAHCPVIVVRGGRESRDGTHRRILLGVGEAPAGAAAARFAVQEAEARRCALDAVRAWRRPAHETTDDPPPAAEPSRSHRQRASELLDDTLRDAVSAHRDVDIHRLVVEGPARNVLLDRSAGADLLVVGARRRHGHFGLQLGRVPHALLHHAACPVAVVPQHE